MRLQLSVPYNCKVLTRELTAEESAIMLRVLEGSLLLETKWENSSHKTYISEEELEIDVIMRGSKKTPEIPLRQSVIEAVIKEAADEALPNG